MGRNFLYRNEDDRVKSELIVQYTPLCHKLAKKYHAYYPTLYEYDDWFQIAQIGLLKAINTYQGEKGAKFITYATIVIKRHLLQEINTKTNQEYIKKVTVSADIKPGQKFLNKNRNMSEAPPGEDVVLSAVAYKQKTAENHTQDAGEEEDEMLNNILIDDIIDYVALSKLFSEMERTIFRLRIEPTLKGEPISYTQSDVSHIVGKSQEYVCLLEKRVRGAIQVYIAGRGLTIIDGHIEAI